MVQIYNEPMLETVKEVHAFPSIIYTLYATQDTEDQVVDFVQKNDIDAVTMPEYKVNQNFVAKLNSAGRSLTYTPLMTLNRWLTMRNGACTGFTRTC